MLFESLSSMAKCRQNENSFLTKGKIFTLLKKKSLHGDIGIAHKRDFYAET